MVSNLERVLLMTSLVFEEDEFAELLPNFLFFGFLIGQRAQMMKPNLPVESCNSLDEHEPVVACWAAVHSMLVQVLKALWILFMHHLQYSCSQS